MIKTCMYIFTGWDQSPKWDITARLGYTGNTQNGIYLDKSI